MIDPREPKRMAVGADPTSTLPPSGEAVRKNEVAIIAIGERPTIFAPSTTSAANLQKGVDRLWSLQGSGAYLLDGIVEAMDLRPDLVICAGNALVDALALVTASHLDQQFLVVGAQLPEPTVNVTAAIWRGASSRGWEVPNMALSFDQDAFTPEHAGAAIRAGVASVLSDLTGIVIWLD